jgi:hypothetical protein
MNGVPKVCARKQRWETRELAQAHCDLIITSGHAKNAARLKPYGCSHCKGFHAGTTKGRKTHVTKRKHR